MTTSGRTSDTTATTLAYTWKHLNVYSVSANTGTCLDYFPITRALLRRLIPRAQRIAQEAERSVQLIRNASGIAEAGELLAIMGSSGAGKTTLLNTLAFRSAADIRVADDGVRAANGVPIRADQLRQHCAYVEQLDVFIGSLTPLEHLSYQAELRLDARWSRQRKMQRVADTMLELSLTACANTAIGELGETKGLSGGERKRLAFATETLNNPAILLCDEPTSGLDSFMSMAVLQVLQRMARKGKTIILTIHQPSSALVAMFDKLMLMAAGRMAFCGTPAQALAFFEAVGAKCPANFCPTDHYVQVLGVRPGYAAEDNARVENICNTYASSELGRAMMEKVNKSMEVTDDRRRTSLRVGGADERMKPGWWRQFVVLYKRAGMSMLKQPNLIRVRIVSALAVAIIIGGIYWQQPLTMDGVMNMNGALFLVILTQTFANIFSVIDVFCSEMPVFMRESRGELYRTDTYFLGKSLAEMPLFILTPLLTLAIVYPMVGYNGAAAAWITVFALVTLMANVATSFSYLASCASPSISVALSVAPPIIVPITVFSGYFLNLRSVPTWLSWCPYLSWLRYAFEGWMICQWRDYGLGAIECVAGQPGCFPSGKYILEFFDFPEKNLTMDFVGLLVLFFVFRFAAYLSLRMRTSSKE